MVRDSSRDEYSREVKQVRCETVVDWEWWLVERMCGRLVAELPPTLVGVKTQYCVLS